jgi:phage gp36-like protein
VATTSYATQGEFLNQLSILGGFADVPGNVIDTALIWASSRVNSYIKKRVMLPLSAWSEDLKVATCWIAAKYIIDSRGVDYQSGTNETVQKNHDTQIEWLRDIAKGLCELDTYVDSSPEVDEATPIAASDPITNWDYSTRKRGSYDEC